ncbi:hypothetical protein P3875_03875 [Myroides sp. JBRI-B21084]|uniref:hypothetical protein n=1 Tax=Myroides sp. JBRI-B21084 TaxID=3119977 RepID=UPI0026E12C8D|nr:hypothetical protein [Paenimyroides cloacae]WKW47210.1 hypothetical protein P3875_03875 [Paenimyroides cloacae]
MKKIYFALFIFISIGIYAQTNYEPEQIIWNGKTYPYRYHHMEQYFRYYPSKRPIVNKDSTILNRNYVAVFEVINKKFYLNNLFISGTNSKIKNQSVLTQINSKNEPMFLNWINGLFDIGISGEKFVKNDSITPVYDNYIVFEVKKGEITRTENFTYNQLKLFKDYQLRRFKQTIDYDKLLQRLINNGMSPFEASTHIYNFILFYSKSNFLK